MHKPKYIEYSFRLPFYELYYPSMDFLDADPQDTSQIEKVLAALGININLNWLFEYYNNLPTSQNSVFVAYSKTNPEQFLFLDLFKDPTDQMSVITFGIRLAYGSKTTLKKLLAPIYLKSTTRSNFEEDYFNHKLKRFCTENKGEIIPQ